MPLLTSVHKIVMVIIMDKCCSFVKYTCFAVTTSYWSIKYAHFTETVGVHGQSAQCLQDKLNVSKRLTNDCCTPTLVYNYVYMFTCPLWPMLSHTVKAKTEYTKLSHVFELVVWLQHIKLFLQHHHSVKPQPHKAVPQVNNRQVYTRPDSDT